MTAQERIVSALTAKNNELARSHNNAAQSAQGQATALSTLTQKQREALKGIQDQVARSRYIENNVAAGWSRAKAEAAADYRDAAGIGYARKLTEQELKTVELGFKVQQQNKAREESEKKIEEGKRKQAELAQKQYQYTSSELEMLKKVAAISSKYQLNEIGAQYGVPENLLAGIMAQESKGNTNARSPTGAIGAFQTTSIFRKQWGLTVEDSLKDIPKTAEAVAKALQQGYKEFGNWEDAITSINAGIGGTRSLNKNGFTGSAAKTKEANEYAGLVDKWYVGLSGSNSKSAGFTSEDAAESLADYQDYLSNMEQLKKEAEEKQKSITEKYLTDEARLTGGRPSGVKGLSLQSPFEGTSFKVQWQAASGATGYLVQIMSGGVLLREVETTNTDYSYSMDEAKIDGVQRAYTVRVASKNGSIVSTFAELNISNPAPPQLLNVYTSATANSITVTWIPSEAPDLKDYQVWVSTVAGFDPDTTEANWTGTENACTISGLQATTTYYVRVAARDVWKSTSWNYSAQITQATADT